MFHQKEVCKENIFKFFNLIKLIEWNLFKTAKYSYSPKDMRKHSFELQRKNNQLMIGAVNYERLNSNLRPIQNLDPKLYELCLNEVDRSAAAGQFVEPEWKGFRDNKAMLIGVSFIGKTTVRDFVFASESNLKCSYEILNRKYLYILIF